MTFDTEDAACKRPMQSALFKYVVAATSSSNTSPPTTLINALNLNIMKISTSITVLSSILSFTTALATPAKEIESPSAVVVEVDKRQQIDKYYIHLYADKNYGGRVVDLQGAWGICQTIIQENDDWASSAKADSGGKCQLYPDHKCVGTPLTVTSTGVADFSTVGYDNTVSAFRCGA